MDMNETISRAVASEIANIASIITESGTPGNQWIVVIPEPSSMDRAPEELASLVARTSNAYARLARLAGLAKANQKIAQGAYNRKFKQSKVGANEAQRQANALSAAKEEHDQMLAAEALYAVAEALENGARVASESARKLYDKYSNMFEGERRSDYGSIPRGFSGDELVHGY